MQPYRFIRLTVIEDVDDLKTILQLA